MDMLTAAAGQLSRTAVMSSLDERYDSPRTFSLEMFNTLYLAFLDSEYDVRFHARRKIWCHLPY